MDEITTAILTVLRAKDDLAESRRKDVLDVYTYLKGQLADKFGVDSDLIKAIAALEARPNSEGRASLLAEKIVQANVHRDTEILRLAIFLTKVFYAGGSHELQISNVNVSDDDIIIQRSSLAGNSTTDAPPPKKKKDK